MKLNKEGTLRIRKNGNESSAEFSGEKIPFELFSNKSSWDDLFENLKILLKKKFGATVEIEYYATSYGCNWYSILGQYTGKKKNKEN